jgi:uncharacterized membrane protein YhaH (DUF805 family)
MSDQYPPNGPTGDGGAGWGQNGGPDRGGQQGPTGGGQYGGSPYGGGQYGGSPYGGGHYGGAPSGGSYGGGQYGQYGRSGGPQSPYGGPAGRGEPPLWAPWYGISFPHAFLRFWKKYVRFDGRASKSEYWWWALWYVIGNVAASIVGSVFNVAPGVSNADDWWTSAWLLATVVGFIALTVRRLHDVNLPGLLALLFIIPPIGILFSLIVGLIESNPQGQQYDQPQRG